MPWKNVVMSTDIKDIIAIVGIMLGLLLIGYGKSKIMDFRRRK
jgi:hypothetical protein